MVAANLMVEVDMVVEDAIPAVEVNKVCDYPLAHQNMLMVTHDSHPVYSAAPHTLVMLTKGSV